MPCNVMVTNRQKEVLFTIQKNCVQTIVDFVLTREKQKADFLSVEFLSDASTRRMHKIFFNDSSSTDCMSFPIDLANETPPRHLGDVFICPKTALQHVHDDPSLFFDEITLYLVHGLLHLLNYDDLEFEQRKKMKRQEASIMKHLRQHGQILSGKIQL